MTTTRTPSPRSSAPPAVSDPGRAGALRSPRGVTVRPGERAPGEAPDPALPLRLEAAAARGEVGPRHLWLGHELAQLISPAHDPEGVRRRGLAWLVAELSAALADGSTRLPLDPEARRRSVRALGGGLADIESVDRVCRELGALARPIPEDTSSSSASPFRGLVGRKAPAPLRVRLVSPPVPVILEPARTAVLEERLAHALAARLARPSGVPPRTLDHALAELDASPPERDGRPVHLSEEQRAAVRAALVRAITVVTGGPGTGKTAIVVSVLRAAARLGDLNGGASADPGGALAGGGIALAAPTGRAADRMRRSVAAALGQIPRPGFADLALLRSPPPASTLHRLLAFDPATGTAGHHSGAPLPYRLLVLDEASMADLELLDALLQALPGEARLVVLGDADQLPSVDGGAGLRDLVRHLDRRGDGALLRLTRSFRMDPADPAGRHVLSVARRVQVGDPALATLPADRPRGRTAAAALDPLPIPFAPEAPAGLPPPGVSGVLALDATARAQALDRWAEAMGGALLRSPDPSRWSFPDGFGDPATATRLAALFREREAAQVLALSRRSGGLLGVEALNRWFAWRRREHPSVPPVGDHRSPPPLRPGEPVLATRNDYERGLWNGDPGIVVSWPRPSGGQARAVAFPGVVDAAGDPERARRFLHPLAAVQDQVERAYATTVHKAQGGEHDAVLLVLPPAAAGGQGVPGPERLATRELVYTALTRARRHATVLGTPEALAAAVGRRLERDTGLAERLAEAADRTGALEAAEEAASRTSRP